MAIGFASGRKDAICHITASADRIDSSRGYVEGNVQWVHKWINLMKLDHSQHDFISYCAAVAIHNSSTSDIVFHPDQEWLFDAAA
jgi:hypothetical protein